MIIGGFIPLLRHLPKLEDQAPLSVSDDDASLFFSWELFCTQYHIR